MPLSRPGPTCRSLVVATLAGWLGGAVSSRVSAQEPPRAEPPPPATTVPLPGPPAEARPVGASPDVTEPPPTGDFVVIPLRVHILGAPGMEAIDCKLADDDIRRIVGKVNGIWHRAGIHWALDPIVREPAARLDQFRAVQEAGARGDGLGAFRLLAPEGSRSRAGIDVYYIHKFPVNGVFLGNRTAFVQETARLRAVPGGIDEPLPRVTAHELGHALGLPHRQDRLNLLASGTTGTTLNRAEVDLVRAGATKIPGARGVPDLRRDLDAARARHDAAEAARLGGILDAVAAPPAPVPAPRPAPAVPPGGPLPLPNGKQVAGCRGL